TSLRQTACHWCAKLDPHCRVRAEPLDLQAEWFTHRTQQRPRDAAAQDLKLLPKHDKLRLLTPWLPRRCERGPRDRGSATGNRTRFREPLLYPLSYGGHGEGSPSCEPRGE